MNLLLIVKIYCAGLIVLFGAILVNVLALYLNITGWYGFIKSINGAGLASAFRSLSFISALFLFILYPLALGLLSYVGWKICLLN